MLKEIEQTLLPYKSISQVQEYIVNTSIIQFPINFVSEVYSYALGQKENLYETINDVIDEFETKLEKKLVTDEEKNEVSEDEKSVEKRREIYQINFLLLLKKTYILSKKIEEVGVLYGRQFVNYLLQYKPYQLFQLIKKIEIMDCLQTMKILYDISTEQFKQKIYQPTCQYLTITFTGVKQQVVIILDNVKSLDKGQIINVTKTLYSEIIKIKDKDVRSAYIKQLKEYYEKLLLKEKAQQLYQKSVDIYQTQVATIKKMDLKEAKNQFAIQYQNKKQYIMENFEHIKKIVEERKQKQLEKAKEESLEVDDDNELKLKLPKSSLKQQKSTENEDLINKNNEIKEEEGSPIYKDN